MSMSPHKNAFSIVLTPKAQQKIQTLVTQGDASGARLHIYIMGGGCSGFQYCFAFSHLQTDSDAANEALNDMVTIDDPSWQTPDGPLVGLLVDSMSLMYLTGSKIDYLEDLQGSRFIIHNPNAKTTCSCGASFAI